MCGVSLRERKTITELRKSLGIKDIDEVMRQSRLRWMGHVLRKDKDDWVRRNTDMVIEGERGVERPRMTWVKAVESDMRVKGLMREDAEDRTKLEGYVMGSKRLTPTIVGKIASKRLLLLLFIYSWTHHQESDSKLRLREHIKINLGNSKRIQFNTVYSRSYTETNKTKGSRRPQRGTDRG